MGALKEWAIDFEETYNREPTNDDLRLEHLERSGPFTCECLKCDNDMDDLCDECKDRFVAWNEEVNKLRGKS